MILGENIDSVYSAGKEIQRVYSLGKLVWEKKTNDDIYSNMPFTVKAITNGVSVRLHGVGQSVINYKYSINGGSWIETDTSTIINIKKDDSVSYKGLDIRGCKIEGLSDIYGNIMSLQYDDNFIGQTVWLLDGTSYYFAGSDIRSAQNLILPATRLQPDCYSSMFLLCESLTTPPVLPATTLAEECYSHMFWNCTSLTTAPELPATTLKTECYASMFYNCTSLTTAPVLPATTLAEECYSQMFYGCTSLNYIKCYATDDINYNSFNWAYGTSTNGKLLCKRVNGGKNPLENFIPSTWSVEYFT